MNSSACDFLPFVNAGALQKRWLLGGGAHQRARRVSAVVWRAGVRIPGFPVPTVP